MLRYRANSVSNEFHQRIASLMSVSCMLVLEDDAFFDTSTLDRVGNRVDAFLMSDTPYGLLLLGWERVSSPPRRDSDTNWTTVRLL